MPYRTVYVPMKAWVPPRLPDLPERPERPVDPGWGLPEGPGGGGGDDGIWGGPWLPQGRPLPPFEWPEGPETGLPPGFWGGITGGRPGQPLPRPRPGGPFPIVPEGEIGSHPPLPDLNMPGRWATVTAHKGKHGYPAWIIDPVVEPPEVDEGYEARHPADGVPGTWVTVLYRDAVAWAWVPDVEAPEPEPEPETLGRLA